MHACGVAISPVPALLACLEAIGWFHGSGWVLCIHRKRHVVKNPITDVWASPGATDVGPDLTGRVAVILFSFRIVQLPRLHQLLGAVEAFKKS